MNEDLVGVIKWNYSKKNGNKYKEDKKGKQLP